MRRRQRLNRHTEGAAAFAQKGASATPNPYARKEDEMTAPDNRNCVILNDIHIDIMDYIAPASCSDVQVSDVHVHKRARARAPDPCCRRCKHWHACWFRPHAGAQKGRLRAGL